jgi:tetratricopeptide (TPR) repeat protein
MDRKVPLNLDLSLRKVSSLIRKLQPIEAALLLADVLDRFPSNKRAMTLLSEINVKSKSSVSRETLLTLQNLVRAGSAGDALEAVKKLPAMAFGSADLQMILGQAQAALNRRVEAVKHFDLATTLQPRQPSFWLAAGNDAYLARDWNRAINCLDEARRLEPKNLDVLNNLGMALAGANLLERADSVFAEATALDPSNVRVAYNRGNFLRDAGRLEDAIASYQHALSVDPLHSFAANNLGTVLHQLGRDVEAEEAYFKAVHARPDYAQAHRNLSAVHRYHSGDQLVSVLDSQLSATSNERDRMYLNFARSKAHEDCGEFPKAFERLVEANSIRKKLLNYTMATDELLFSTLRDMFSIPLTQIDAQESKPRPVFVLGMMRSGTTLVEQILSSHSAVHGAGELEALGSLCLPMMETFHASKQRPTETDLQGLRNLYIDELKILAQGAAVVTDKMPSNFLWIGFILASLPEAKIIHMRRDPVATCWSIFKHHFSSDGNGYAFDLKDVAAYWHLYSSLMQHWHGLFPGRILDVPYETLTEEPETWSRRIVEFSGLPWEEACLDFHMNKRAVRTASASQVRKKMYKGSSEAWMKYEAQLATLKEDLQYKSIS